jgi:hypothetical protein
MSTIRTPAPRSEQPGRDVETQQFSRPLSMSSVVIRRLYR